MDGPRRARELGIAPGKHPPGRYNAITDVGGVRVGHTTLHQGTGIRTGVTAVVPDAVDLSGGELPAGLFVGNGYGKMIDATQVVELGCIETTVVLTGTLSAFRVADALTSFMLALPGNEEMLSVNPVVGETNDGFLSDIRSRPVTEAHVLAALSGARGGPVAEGTVGAGTGTGALGFKAGIGTASRTVPLADGLPATVGVLLQANFSGTLSVLGVPIDAADALAGRQQPDAEPEGNSCMIVVAVDRALDARQLTRLARRAIFALGRAGSDFAGGSGDYALAFATAQGQAVTDAVLGPVFEAVQESVAEAVLNSVFMATTTTGYLGHVRYACPHDYVLRAVRKAGVIG